MVKIYEFCPFLNENRVAEIKIKENSRWIDELYILEANKTFNYEDKLFNFHPSGPQEKVVYHPLKVEDIFRKPERHPTKPYPQQLRNTKDFDRWYWDLLSYYSAFDNEAIQRNLCIGLLHDRVQNDDLVILSDFDEIIDSRFAGRIIEEVQKHQVITIKLHYAAFFVNLFCASSYGAPHYSYRVFIMTGRFFKSMPFSPDYLRKKGTANMLSRQIYCLTEPAGYHYSWLEYQKTAEEKAEAYNGRFAGQPDSPREYFNKCINDKKLYHMNAKLYVDNRKFLRAITEVNTDGLWYGK